MKINYIPYFFVSFLLLSCNEKEEPKALAFSMSKEMIAASTFETAKLVPVRNELKFFGKLQSDNNKIAEVNAVVSGVVKSIHVSLGDYVKQGQVLAVIQSSEVATFQKEKLEAKSQLQIAQKNYEVSKQLNSSKLNADADVAMALKDLQIAEAEQKRLNQIFAIYNLQKDATFNVVAPISGFIITKDVTINDHIKSDRDIPLFNIAEINEIWAVAQVNEVDIAQIKPNAQVVVQTIAFPEELFEGRIEKIYNVINPETKAMGFRVRIPNSDFKLKPEMNCTVTVTYQESNELIQIPSEALIFEKNKHWVMVYHSPTDIETRAVEVYRQLGQNIFLSKGLEPGDQVISKNGLYMYNALNN
ncbi:MAG: efflux RND transporter periplasmic adaptor subunit [Flavobacterium sp.]|nr:efflux RND transporter periplasmic adaptor subunit [Candidatus Neoflavobacterium equi]